MVRVSCRIRARPTSDPPVRSCLAVACAVGVHGRRRRRPDARPDRARRRRRSRPGPVRFKPGQYRYEFGGRDGGDHLRREHGRWTSRTSGRRARRAGRLRHRRRPAAARREVVDAHADPRRRRARRSQVTFPARGHDESRSAWWSCCSATPTGARSPRCRSRDALVLAAGGLGLAGLPAGEHEDQVAQPVQVAPHLGVDRRARPRSSSTTRRSARRTTLRATSSAALAGFAPGTMKTSGAAAAPPGRRSAPRAGGPCPSVTSDTPCLSFFALRRVRRRGPRPPRRARAGGPGGPRRRSGSSQSDRARPSAATASSVVP